MAGGGRRGQPGSGKKKGSFEKKTIGRAGRIIAIAEDLKASKITQNRSYLAWEKAIHVVEDVWAEYQRLMSDPVIRPTAINECQDRLLKAIKVVLPYEKPRLQVIKLQGDKSAPLFDLTGLSDKELEFLRKTVLKANQIAEEG